MRRVVLYGLAGGVLIALLKIIEYKHFVRAYPTEIYGGLVAVIFSALGLYFGLRWARSKEVVVVKEVRVPEGAPFALDAGKLKELGITEPGEIDIEADATLGFAAQADPSRCLQDRIIVYNPQTSQRPGRDGDHRSTTQKRLGTRCT